MSAFNSLPRHLFDAPLWGAELVAQRILRSLSKSVPSTVQWGSRLQAQIGWFLWASESKNWVNRTNKANTAEEAKSSSDASSLQCSADGDGTFIMEEGTPTCKSWDDITVTGTWVLSQAKCARCWACPMPLAGFASSSTTFHRRFLGMHERPAAIMLKNWAAPAISYLYFSLSFLFKILLPNVCIQHKNDLTVSVQGRTFPLTYCLIMWNGAADVASQSWMREYISNHHLNWS